MTSEKPHIANRKVEGDIFSLSSYDDRPPLNEQDLWKKVYDASERILSSRFSDSSKRQPKGHSDRIQMACVYCGDSAKDSRKKRGNIFSASMQYHCFNGDCNVHRSLHDFLNDYHELGAFTMEEIAFMKERGSSRSLDLRRMKSSQGLESFYSDEVTTLSVDRSVFVERMRLQEIKGSRIEKYLLGRMQRDFHRFAFSPKDNQLFVFNLTNDSRIVGLQIKTFRKENPYITWKISRIHEEMGILKDENVEKLSMMDNLSNMFNIFNVDLNRTVTLFEGPLDSFLFPNAVGLCSAKNSLPFDIEGARYFYDNDRTGKEWALRRIQSGSPVFLWRKYIHDSELSDFQSSIKDLNDLMLVCRKNNLKPKKLADYFSNSHYDAIWI